MGKSTVFQMISDYIHERNSYENKPEFMLHHLYVCPQNSKELKWHLAFRDYLRMHYDAVQDYSKVKREGAALYRAGT